ncbi:MAG: NAD(P)/FAD-dependent oxidoreductase [Gammaproteobacteria bacterium]|nr:NAD(P)/FAD-dependent oxidoreductase [Gammaproteobacteria bacterium]
MPIETDALIIGAGPCGLFQVFELGLLGIQADVVDSLPAVGGQCTWLYPDKPIYDIPAVPVCTGQGLVDALLKQIAPFKARMHLGEEVTTLSGECGHFRVGTSIGSDFLAKTIFIAGGVGSFQPRKLKLAGLDALEEHSIHYRVREPGRYSGAHLVILGGGDSALDWALALAPQAKSLTLVHRSDQFRAAPASLAAFREFVATGRARLIEFGNAVAFSADGTQLKSLTVRRDDGSKEVLAADHAFAFFGMSPKLGPIAEWGLEMERKALKVDTAAFQTSKPGVFAVGDICDYPGKKKLILSGFHEAALAAFAAKAIIEPGKKVHLQYTTTSPLMQQRLGVTAEGG